MAKTPGKKSSGRSQSKIEKIPQIETGETKPVKKLKMKKKLNKELQKMDLTEKNEMDGTYTFKRQRKGEGPIRYIIDVNKVPFDVSPFKERLDKMVDSKVILKFSDLKDIPIKDGQKNETGQVIPMYTVHFFAPDASLLFKTRFIFHVNWQYTKILKEGTTHFIEIDGKRVNLSHQWVERLKDTYVLIEKNENGEISLYNGEGIFLFKFDL